MATIAKNPRTDSDVATLIAVFPDLLPDGREIKHEQIEAVLQEARTTARSRRVVRAWRRRLLIERGVYLDGMSANGRGYVALTPDEMVRFGNRKVREAGRRLRAGLRVAGTPDDSTLSEGMRRYRALLLVVVERMAKNNHREIIEISKALRPQAQLPRAAPPPPP